MRDSAPHVYEVSWSGEHARAVIARSVRDAAVRYAAGLAELLAGEPSVTLRVRELAGGRPFAVVLRSVRTFEVERMGRLGASR